MPTSFNLQMRLAALTGGHLFGNCTIMALAAIATNLKNELGINAEEYGWLIGIYMIVQGFIAIPGGLLIDYIGTRIVFASSMLSSKFATPIALAHLEYLSGAAGIENSVTVGKSIAFDNPCGT